MMLNYPEIDWKHKTVPQKHSCFGLPNNKSHWSQGKGLGGTSNINFLIQSRGHPKDFDNWANLTGDTSWSYENLLPYFRMSEDYHGPWDNARTHGKGGPIRVALPEYTGMADVYVKAAGELGYPRQDLNGYYTEGFDTIFYPIKNGRRFGVYGAYIESAIKRPDTKLTVRRFAHAKKVLINELGVAYGIEYDWHGAQMVAYSAKEVIISAGAMMSPQLLMLSGIGPKEHLEFYGIPVVSDRPVGKNLQDHISAYLGPFFVDQPISFSIERDVTSINVANFAAQGTGVLTTSGTQAMGFFSSTHAKERGEGDWPDIQFILAGVAIGKNFATDFARGFGVKKKLLEKYWDHAVGTDSFLQIVSLGRPKARGDIKLQSIDPYTPALIDPKYLDNKHDLDILVEAVKKGVELVEETKTFKRINGRFTDQAWPGCEHLPFKSDAYYECYVTHFSVTLHHIVGSCSMGAVNSPDAVVDTQLRVIGVDRLRVIDASVMPVVVVGNTNVPTIMIGEKGADMILKDYEEERLAIEEARRQVEEEARRKAAEEEAKKVAAQAQLEQELLKRSTTPSPPTEVTQPPDDPDDPDDPEDPEDTDRTLLTAEILGMNVTSKSFYSLSIEEQDKMFLSIYSASQTRYYNSVGRNFTGKLL
ncbi:oxygen-dependent choline dehydrogenase 1 isoform X2 [Folsomia candida]|nr:oxygen-dependent choline dehydrogenase 1 isoform X2 [Folsomia candida]